MSTLEVKSATIGSQPGTLHPLGIVERAVRRQNCATIDDGRF
jgi:hypothetical protein